jgi:hypothetical protein
MSLKAFFSASSRRENVNTAYAQDAASMILENANALPRHAPAVNVADPSLMVKIVDDHTRTATDHMYINVLMRHMCNTGKRQRRSKWMNATQQ